MDFNCRACCFVLGREDLRAETTGDAIESGKTPVVDGA